MNLKDKIVSIIEQRVDSADLKGTPEGLAEAILTIVNQIETNELMQKDVPNALAIVIDLASQNVIDDREMPEEAAVQNGAIETVEEYLELLKSPTDLQTAANELEELAGVDIDTFMDRVENSHDDYLGWWKPLYNKMARLIETAKVK